MTTNAAQLPDEDDSGIAGLSPAEATRLDELKQDLVALASLPRLRMLHMSTTPHYAEEFADALGVSRQAARKHASQLEQRGFVRAVAGQRASGPVVEYLVVPSRIFALCIELSELTKLTPSGGPLIHKQDPTINVEGHSDAAPSPAPMPPRLLDVNGPHAGARHIIGDGPRWTIGRDEDRSLRIAHDPFVSGRHAEIQTDWQGRMLVDALSANGTFLNFARLPRGGRALLNPGDLIGVGRTMFVYQEDR